MILFPGTRSATEIHGYVSEYSFFQDLIMFIAIFGGILHFIPATGYLFYSEPVTFCAAHVGSMWCALVTTTRFQELQTWQYFVFDSEQYIVEMTLSATCIIFMVVFAIFLAISGVNSTIHLSQPAHCRHKSKFATCTHLIYCIL